MGMKIFSGVERANQIKYGHFKPVNLINVVDDGDTLVFYMRDPEPLEQYYMDKISNLKAQITSLSEEVMKAFEEKQELRILLDALVEESIDGERLD